MLFSYFGQHLLNYGRIFDMILYLHVRLLIAPLLRTQKSQIGNKLVGSRRRIILSAAGGLLLVGFILINTLIRARLRIAPRGSCLTVCIAGCALVLVRKPWWRSKGSLVTVNLPLLLVESAAYIEITSKLNFLRSLTRLFLSDFVDWLAHQATHIFELPIHRVSHLRGFINKDHILVTREHMTLIPDA